MRNLAGGKVGIESFVVRPLIIQTWRAVPAHHLA